EPAERAWPDLSTFLREKSRYPLAEQGNQRAPDPSVHAARFAFGSKPSRNRLSAVATCATTRHLGSQPSTRLAFSLLAFLTFPSSGTSCAIDESTSAASRTTQSGSTLVGMRLPALPMRALSTWAISCPVMKLPVTA